MSTFQVTDGVLIGTALTRNSNPIFDKSPAFFVTAVIPDAPETGTEKIRSLESCQ
jgi:hypothetical protein